MSLLRSKKWIALLAAIVICGGGSYAYLKMKPAQKTGAAQQRVVQVTKGEIKQTVSGTSQFEPGDVQNITAPVDGTIKTMNLTRNQEVKKGDLLFDLSDPSLDAGLQSAQINLQQAEKDLNDLLYQQSHMQITAPASGILTLSSNVEAGSSVSDKGKIGTISDTSTYTVQLQFPAAEAGQLKKGDTVELTVSGYMLTKTGTVDSVEKELKAGTNGQKTLTVHVTVPNDGTLSDAMKVTGTITIGGAEIDSIGEGELDYLNTVSIFSEAAGIVDKLAVKDGNTVKKGELIATLTNDDLADDIVSKQADIENKKILVQDAQEKVDQLKVYAPFDGTFSADFANQKSNVLASYPSGSTIEQGTQLGGVANLETMVLPIAVDELDLPKIKQGQKAEISVDALPEKKFEGEVTQISSVGTTSNGVTTYDVVLTVKNTDAKDLKNGMTATAEILIQDEKDTLVLPAEAIQSQRGKKMVMLQKADGTTERKEITVGISNTTYVQVKDGLAEGDKVVVPTTQKSSSMTQEQLQQLRNSFQGGAGGTGNRSSNRTGSGGGGFMAPGGF